MRKFISRYHYIIYLGLSFLILDFYLRLNNPGTGIARIISASPNLFTLSYILLFIGILLLLKPKLRKIIYTILISLFIILFLVNIIYYGIFNSFFSFKNLGLANEGLDYIIPVLKAIDIKIIGIALFSIILSFLALKFIPKERVKLDIVLSIIFIILAVSSYATARHFLGAGVNKFQWDSWNYKRNVYEDYTESKKSLQVSGFYEYVFRDFYFTYIKKSAKNTKKDIAYLDNYFDSVNDVNTLSTNEYQGLFKNKNVIVVLMESIDSWLVTEDVMPTLYKMMKEGINFTNHYSVMYDSGATFNSEFMVNTGYMTPYNGGLAAYTYGDNKYPYSLANLFKDKGYIVNQFHFNDGNFYNRSQMSKAYGYENYYSGEELGYANSFEDSVFMNEEELSNLMLPNQKFMTFFTTYSAHMPYTLDSQECSILISSERDRKAASKDEEMSCIKAQASETDNFFKLLLDNLAKKKILDNTVIIGVTDHYTYAFTDQNTVHELKGIIDDNLIHKVPFFIWSNNINHQEITNVNSNIDVLPTIANVFDLSYNPKYYLGKNILDSNYNGFVFFRDYSWYDGNTYFKNNKVIGNVVSNEYIKEKNSEVNNILDINKKVLETNYFDILKKD